MSKCSDRRLMLPPKQGCNKNKQEKTKGRLLRVVPVTMK